MTSCRLRCAFPAVPASAAHARRFVESVLVDAGMAGMADTAVLLVSELVANAVLHTAGGKVVWCRIDQGGRPALDLLEVDAI
jgi:hypothetical protein